MKYQTAYSGVYSNGLFTKSTLTFPRIGGDKWQITAVLDPISDRSNTNYDHDLYKDGYDGHIIQVASDSPVDDWVSQLREGTSGEGVINNEKVRILMDSLSSCSIAIAQRAFGYRARVLVLKTTGYGSKETDYSGSSYY